MLTEYGVVWVINIPICFYNNYRERVQIKLLLICDKQFRIFIPCFSF